MPGTVVHTAERVYIENVPHVSWDTGNDTFVMALQAASEALGRPVSYSRLKGDSATAFRLVFPENWQRFWPDALQGYDHTEAAFRSLGLRGASLRSTGAVPSADAGLREMVYSSIEAGYPAPALRLMTWEDWGVILGYERDSERLLCRTPHDLSPDFSGNEYWPRMILTIHGELPRPAPLESARLALRIAVKLFEAARFEGLFCGRNAYRYWIEGLRDAGLYTDLGEPDPREYGDWIVRVKMAEMNRMQSDRPYRYEYFERLHVNAWRLASLIDARQAAAAYLRESTSLFEPPADQDLLTAADLYAQVGWRLEKARPLAPSEWDVDTRPWTQTGRDRQADLLAEALELESRAVDCLAQALERAGF